MALLPSLGFDIYNFMKDQKPPALPVMNEPKQHTSVPSHSFQDAEGQSQHTLKENDDKPRDIYWFNPHNEELEEPPPLFILP